MRRRVFSYLSGPLVLSLLTFADARAGQIDVKVGYADGLRANGFFPDPWGGAAGVIFDGRNPTGTFDDGAIRIDNIGATDVTISNIVVDGFENTSASFSLWSSHVIHPGEKLILTATSGDNFDTSDLPIHAGPSEGGYASSAIPKVHFTVDGSQDLVFSDTGQILNTGGFDRAVNSSGSFVFNESLGWRDIGTTGINDPGGDQTTIPEPGGLALFSLGLVALAVCRSARRPPVD